MKKMLNIHPSIVLDNKIDQVHLVLKKCETLPQYEEIVYTMNNHWGAWESCSHEHEQNMLLV